MMADDEEHLKMHKQYGQLRVSSESLVPSYLSEMFQDIIHRDLEAHIGMLRFGNEWGRKHHQVSRPNSEYETPTHEADLKAWRELTERGIEEGWLDYGEEGYVEKYVPKLLYETIYDETEEEWEARKATLPEVQTFKIITRYDIPQGKSVIMPDEQ